MVTENSDFIYNKEIKNNYCYLLIKMRVSIVGKYSILV